jgi:hypothetical protein
VEWIRELAADSGKNEAEFSSSHREVGGGVTVVLSE